jgi:hypothetical protein
LKQKSTRLFQLATLDWLEILSAHGEFSIEQTHNEIDQEIDFSQVKIVKAHHCFFAQVTDLFYVSYKNRKEEIIIEEIPKKEFKLLLFISQKRSIEDLAEESRKNGFIEVELQTLFTSWIKNNIISCM